MRPTWRAAGLLGAGLALMITAAGLQSLTLAQIAALVLTVPLIGLCWVLATAALAPRPRLRRVVRPLRPVVGSRAQVDLAAQGGAVPLFAQLRDRSPAMIRRSQLAPGTTGRSRWAYLIEPRQRGRFDLGPSTVVYGDPMHLVRWHRRGDDAEPILIWPRTADVDHILRPGELHTAAPSRSGALRRSVEDLTLREYRTGDDVHRVHWRSSARRGTLMVRADEPVRPPAVDLILSLSATAGSQHNEWAVSAAASVAMALSRDRMPLTLHTCREEAGHGGSTTAPLSSDHVGHVLDALATARPLPQMSAPEHQALREAHRREADQMGPTVVAVLTAPSAEALDDLAPLARSRRCFALIVDQHPQQTFLSSTGWSVHGVNPRGAGNIESIPPAFAALFDETRLGAGAGR